MSSATGFGQLKTGVPDRPGRLRPLQLVVTLGGVEMGLRGRAFRSRSAGWAAMGYSWLATPEGTSSRLRQDNGRWRPPRRAVPSSASARPGPTEETALPVAPSRRTLLGAAAALAATTPLGPTLDSANTAPGARRCARLTPTRTSSPSIAPVSPRSCNCAIAACTRHGLGLRGRLACDGRFCSGPTSGMRMLRMVGGVHVGSSRFRSPSGGFFPRVHTSTARVRQIAFRKFHRERARTSRWPL
jgi:hypothetical protein